MRVCLVQLKNNEKVGVVGMKWERKVGNDEVVEIMWGLTMP